MGVPLELLVLGSLHYLGRGWTFDDLDEATGISEESHRVFFHRFISCGRKFLFPKWVKAPQTASEIEDSMSEYAAAGYPGCIGSTDASHIIIDKCYKHLKNQNPYYHKHLRPSQRWSKWAESMRKDVECTFGTSCFL